MNPLPPERDLPEAALAAIVAGSTVGVSLTRDGAAPHVPAAASTSPAPSDATLLEACRRSLIGLDPERTNPGRLRVIARFADEYGIMLLAQNTRTTTTCTFHPDGTPANPRHGSSGGERLGYLDPRTIVPVLAAGWGIGAVTSYGGRPAVDTREVTGIVKRGVAKVVVTFQGHPPISVVPGVGAFVARLVIPAGSAYPNDPYMTFVAYDKDGHELGRSQLNQPLASATPTPSAPPTTTTSSPSPTGTSPAALLARCVAGAAADATPDMPLGTQRILTLFSDRYGFLLRASSDTSAVFCELAPDGTVMTQGSLEPLLSSGPGTYLPSDPRGPVAGANPVGWGSLGASQPGRPVDGSHHAFGTIRRDVAKLQVTWKGLPPVWAAISGPNFAARVVVPGVPKPPSVRATMVAFDRAGRRLGSSGFSG
jgi:hypothetical protein